MKHWIGHTPETCDTCNSTIYTSFIDGKTTSGSWAIMCPSCHLLGPGLGQLGTGLGQKYQKDRNGRFQCVS